MANEKAHRLYTTEWKQKRFGLVTASRFQDTMTQPRSKADKEAGLMSETAKAYAYQLIGERDTGLDCSGFGGNEATRHGHEWEATALEVAYGLIGDKYGHLNLPEEPRTFIEHPTEEMIGCSPDALYEGIGFEVKCPFNSKYHVQTVIEGYMPKKHEAQVQGTLWICGLQKYVFVSFDPRATRVPKLFIKEVDRDDEYIEKLSKTVVAFRDYVDQTYDSIMETPF